MIKLTKGDEVENERFMQISRISNMVYFDIEKFRIYTKRMAAMHEGTCRRLKSYMSLISGTNVEKLTYTTIREYLINYEEVSPKEFEVYDHWGKFEKYSFDASVRAKLMEKNIAPFFMSMCADYVKLNSVVDLNETFLNGLRSCGQVNNDGFKLGTIPFKYTESATNRIYTKSQSIQGLPIDSCKMISCPKDYFILWADFKQIDFRVFWNLIMRYNNDGTIEDNDDIEDYYNMFAKKTYDSIGMKFVEEVFAEERPLYKAGTLTAVYGGSVSTINSNVNNIEFAQRIFKYINALSNHSYKKYKDLLLKNISLNIPFSCYNYFGTEIYLHPKTDKVLTAGLNRDMQGTSAELIKLVTLKIYDKMQSHLDNTMKFLPYINRHDETLFMMHKSSIPYLYEFLDCCKIRVDDWDILELEWGAGTYYKEEDPELMKQIREMGSKVKNKNQPRTKRKDVYVPFTNSKVVYLHTSIYNDVYVSCILNDKAKAGIIIVDRVPPTFSEISKEINSAWGEELRGDNIDRVIVKQKTLGYNTIDGLEFIADDINYIPDTNISKIIANSVLYGYIKKVKGEVPDEKLLAENARIIREGIDFTWRMKT